MTKKCKSCQTQIDAKAKRCPHCRADQRNWAGRHPILTGLFALIIIVIVLSAVGGSSKNGSTSTTGSDASAQTTAPAKPVIMDATALVGEYDKNKLAAQQKYTGKVVQTTAFISNISSDVTGSYYLSLNPSNDQYYTGTSIQCYFTDEKTLTSLSNGQQVTVQGTMQDMSLGIVEMKDCSLVK